MLALISCDDRPNTWTSFVYRDARNMDRADTVSDFKTFEACQQFSIAVLRSYADPDQGAYACGHRCRWDPIYQTDVCKEIRK
jgi:hypothetical protein